MINSSIEKQLWDLAFKARLNAYAPYSDFAVGAAIESTNGNFYVGCNVENISYPIGTCAEAGAISAMIAGGDTQIRRILIIADSPELITPCGACLQRIKEFSVPQTQVLLSDIGSVRKTLTIQELLPYAFNNEDLKK